MTKKLSGKSALVTGGSRGIGAAAARALAQDGANVAISYTSSPDKAEAVVKELEKFGVKAIAFKADQAEPRQVERLINDVAKHFGKLDILVNNAGVFVTGAVDNPANDVANFDHQYAVNIGGVVAGIRAASRVIENNGRIITIGSVIGGRVGYQGMADYAATKAAVVGYNKGAARDLGARNITVNVIQPGPIDTDMNPANSDFAAEINAVIPLGRYGKPEEIGAAVAFLASPEASYISGSVLNVDGGLSA